MLLFYFLDYSSDGPAVAPRLVGFEAVDKKSDLGSPKPIFWLIDFEVLPYLFNDSPKDVVDSLKLSGSCSDKVGSVNCAIAVRRSLPHRNGDPELIPGVFSQYLI